MSFCNGTRLCGIDDEGCGNDGVCCGNDEGCDNGGLVSDVVMTSLGNRASGVSCVMAEEFGATPWSLGRCR